MYVLLFQAACCVLANQPSFASTTLRKPSGWRVWCPKEEVSLLGTTDSVQVLCCYCGVSTYIRSISCLLLPGSTDSTPRKHKSLWKAQHRHFVQETERPHFPRKKSHFQLGLHGWKEQMVKRRVLEVERCSLQVAACTVVNSSQGWSSRSGTPVFLCVFVGFLNVSCSQLLWLVFH